MRPSQGKRADKGAWSGEGVIKGGVYMENLQMFPKRLRELRREYGYKMKEVAEILGVSVPTVSAYELGSRAPLLPGLVKIAQLYHCSTDYLLGLDDKEPEVSDVGIKINVLKERLKELEQAVARSATNNA